MPNIHIIGGSQYFRPFLPHGSITTGKADIKYADAVVFTGGEDVCPLFYGEEEVHPSTRYNYERDMLEAHIFTKARARGLPMFGICRGAQLLTVLNGGKLYQHVTYHAISSRHSITTADKKKLDVTSTHHQMMKPWKTEHELIAWSTYPLSTTYQDGELNESEEPVVEPEIVYYPKTLSMACQYHPEYMEKESQGYKYYQSLIEEYLR